MDRKKLLELYAKQVSEGNPLSEEFLPALPEHFTKTYPNRIAELRANQAGQLSELALADQVLKNTGIPVPDKLGTDSKTEDFLNRIQKERYPELVPNIHIKSNEDIKKIAGEASGYYSPVTGKIVLNAEELRNPERAVSTLLHEVGHQYDDKVLNFRGTKETMLKNLVDDMPKGKLITDIDPTEAYELMAKGHHANIPNLREGSYGLGALKSMLKSGTFKAVPVIGTGLAAYSALESGDASAAVPFLDQAENAGESKEDERIMLAEDKARKNYSKSQARLDALKKIGGN